MIRYNIATHPQLARIKCAVRNLVCSRHASLRAIEKAIFVPQRIEIKAGEVVECEVEGKTVTKLVVRRSIVGSNHDVVLVLVPKGNDAWTLVTCWTNRSDDTHSTLQRDRVAAENILADINTLSFI